MILIETVCSGLLNIGGSVCEWVLTQFGSGSADWIQEIKCHEHVRLQGGVSLVDPAPLVGVPVQTHATPSVCERSPCCGDAVVSQALSCVQLPRCVRRALAGCVCSRDVSSCVHVRVSMLSYDFRIA